MRIKPITLRIKQLVAATILLSPVYLQPLLGGTITVTSQTNQTIKGWGVFPAYHRATDWGAGSSIVARPNSLGSTNKINIQNALYTELGVSIVRADLSPSYYKESAPDGLDTYYLGDLVAHLQAAKSKGISEYMLSVWSPPWQFKTPARIEGGFWRLKGDGTNKVDWYDGIGNNAAYEKVSTSLREDRESQFVTFYAKAVKYLTTQGLDAPVAVSLQNEPRWDPPYDGCVYAAPQYTRVAIALRTALNGEGLSSVKIIGPETNDYGDKTWGNPIMWKGWYGLAKNNGVPNPLASAMQGIAVHSYDLTNDSYWNMDYFNEYKTSVERLKIDFPSYDFWATEHSIDYENTLGPIGLTMRATRQLNREIGTLPHNYWFWWQGYSTGDPQGHLQALMSGTDANLVRTPMYHVLSRLWRSAPKGSVVRKVSSDHVGITAAGSVEIDTIALQKADGHVVLLVCNPTNSLQNVSLAGLTGSFAKVYQTTSSENMADKSNLPISGGNGTYAFPAQSIVIFDCMPAVGVTVLNPGFESNAGEWQIYGAASRSSTLKRSGNWAMQINGTSSSSGYQQTITGLQSNKSYTVRVWAAGSAANTMLWMGAYNTGGSDGYKTSNLGTNYTEQSFTFTTGPSATSAVLWGWRGNEPTVAYVDDISVTAN